MTESSIQKQIIDSLAACGFLVFRMNSGSRNYNNKQAPKGTPDLLVVMPNKSLWIEVKTESGKVSKDQLIMHERLNKLGQCVIVARSIDDVIKEIK